MANPYVILVGGPGGAGKTTLGRALARRLGADSLSVDDLHPAARAVTTPESHPGLYAMHRALTGLTSVQYFTETPVEKLIDDSNKQHEAMWPVVEAVVRSRIDEQPQIVIDGWFFRPEWVATLDQDNVRSFWIKVDRSVLEQRERAQDYFYSQSTDPERMLQNALARSQWYNDLIEKQAIEYGMPVLHQDGTVSVDEMCEVVLRQLDE